MPRALTAFIVIVTALGAGAALTCAEEIDYVAAAEFYHLPPVEESVVKDGEVHERVELEANNAGRIDRLEAELAKLKKSATPARTESKDSGTPTFKAGGQVVIDALWFGQDSNSRNAVGDCEDAFDFRRARVYGAGEAFHVFNYAMGFDFAQGTGANGRPTFLDNYVGVRELPLVQNFRIGHFFEPLSLERCSSNRNTTFMERSLADAFAPSRNLGAMIFGESESRDWYGALGTFRAGSDNFGDDAGDNEGEAVTSRLVWRYYDEPSDGRLLFHVGGAYSYRQAQDNLIRYRSRPEAFAHSDSEAIQTPFFTDTGDLAAQDAQLYAAELLCVWGSLSLQGEYILSPVNRIGAADDVFTGAYVYVSYFLTGEHRTYNRAAAIPDRVQPFENFFRVRTDDSAIETGSGAWEIAVRLSQIDLTDQTVLGGTLTDVTAGLNWYLTPYHRMKANYIHAHLDRGAVSTTHIFGLRFDFDF